MVYLKILIEFGIKLFRRNFDQMDFILNSGSGIPTTSLSEIYNSSLSKINSDVRQGSELGSIFSLIHIC